MQQDFDSRRFHDDFKNGPVIGGKNVEAVRYDGGAVGDFSLVSFSVMLTVAGLPTGKSV
jgi:hypothetical protein